MTEKVDSRFNNNVRTMSNEASPVLKTKGDDQKSIELLSIHGGKESRP